MASVDEKVVKLSMDESELDKGTKKAINSLDSLKKALEFKDAERGLEAVTKAAAQVDMSPLSTGIGNVTNQFNLLNTVATSAIFNVTNKAIDAGERLIKSLSIDQVNAGWDKFADKTSAVQTIMASTSNQFSDTGKQMEYVETELDKLNWFTDETSYRFLDMVNNIGKFTASNIALDKSVDAMQGIATWAARSGAGVQGASRAMYNLSQSMAMGAVRLQDWMSIENANMATYEFKETALDTAVELGVLKKVTDGLYSTLEGTTITVEGFRESLQKNWMTSDVLIKTLEKYGGFATELNKFYEELGAEVPTTTLLGFIDDFVDGSLDMQHAMTVTGMSAEELGGWLEKLGSEQYKLGRESFKAAQETKTFQEAIDYVKESVSSGWMRTFEYLFGNYEEAKGFFSNMSEWLYDIFVASGDARNGLLMLWKDEGGRDQFIQSLYQIMDNISTFVGMIKDAWNSVFPEKTVDDIWNMSNAFSNFVNALTPTKETVESIKNSLSGLFSILKIGKDITVNVWKATEPLRDSLNRLAGSLVWVIGQLGKKIFDKSGSITDSGALKSFYGSLSKISEIVGDKLIAGFNALYKVSALVFRVIGKIVDVLKNGKMSISDEATAISSIFGALFSKLSSGISKSSSYGGIIASTLNILGNSLRNFISFIGNFLTSLSDAGEEATGIVGNIGAILGGLFKGIANMFSGITIDDVKTIAVIGSLTYLAVNLGSLIRSFRKIGEDVSEIARDMMRSVSMGNVISQLNAALDKTIILQIGVSITLLVNALAKLSSIDVTQLALSVAVLGGIAVGFLAVVKQIGTISKSVKAGEIAKFGLSMSILAGAINIVVSAVTKIGAMDFGSLILGLGALTGILVGIRSFATSLENVDAGKLALVGASISVLAIGLTGMVVPIGLLSLINFNSLVVGLAGLTAILTEIVLFSNNIKNIDFKSLLGASASMIVLSIALNNIGVVVSSLGAMDFGSLILGLGSVAGILVAMVQTSKAFSTIDPKNLTSSAIAITILAASIAVVSESVIKLSALGDQVFTGLTGLGGVLLGFIAVLEGLKLVSNGMNTGQMLAISASLLVLSTSMIAIAGALRLMEGVTWPTVAQGLVAVAGGLALLLGAAAVVQYTGLAAGLGAIVITLTGLSLNLLIVAASIATIVSAMKEFMNMITILAGAAVLFGDDLPRLVQIGVDAFKVAFGGILEAIYENAPKITLAVVSIIAAVKAAVWAAKSDMVLVVAGIGLAILEALKQFGGPIMDALTYVVNMMTEKLPGLMLAIGDFIEQLFAGIGILVTKAIYGLFEAVLNLIPFVGQKLAANLKAESELVGEAYLEGFTKTIQSGEDDAYNASADVGNAAVEGLTSQDGIDSNSPSKKTQAAGKDFNDGFIETIKSGEDDASKAGSDLGVKAADSTEDGVKNGLEDNKESTKADIKSWFNDVVGDLDLGVDIPVNIRLLGGSGTSKSDWQVFEDAVTKYGDDAFTELSKMDEEGRLTSGFISRALRGGYITKRQAEELSKSIRMEIAENQKEKYEKTGDEIGEYVGSGLASSTAPSSAARSQAQTIGDAFSDEIKKLNLNDKTGDALFRLWKAQNPNASEADIAIKEMELQAQKIETQAARAQISQQKYTDTLEKMGESASETHEAYNEMLEDQIKLLELQNEMATAQTQGHEATAEAFQKMNDIMHDYYYTKNNGRTTAEFLKSLGFTDLEIAEAAAKEAGYAIPKIVEDTKDKTVEATQSVGEKTVELYAQSVTTNLESLTPKFQGFGNTYADSLGNGMVEKTADVGNAAVQTINEAREEAGSPDMIKKWEDLGVYLMKGIVQGIVIGSPEVQTAIAEAVQAAIRAAEIAAGVASPSKETMWQASMWMEGYVQGINKNAKKVRTSLTDVVTNALKVANNEFDGGIIGEGTVKTFISGMDMTIDQLNQKVQDLVKTTTEDIDKMLEAPEDEAYYDLVHSLFRTGKPDTNTIYWGIDLSLSDKSKRLLNSIAKMNGQTLPFYESIDGAMSENQFINHRSQQFASILARQIKEQKGTSSEKKASTVQNINMTQNNYSPKSLSRMDIRRDTQNMVTAVANKIRSR